MLPGTPAGKACLLASAIALGATVQGHVLRDDIPSSNLGARQDDTGDQFRPPPHAGCDSINPLLCEDALEEGVAEGPTSEVAATTELKESGEPIGESAQPSQVTVIEDQGVQVTYVQTQLLEHTDNTAVITITSAQDGNPSVPITVGPQGWVWEIVGPAPAVDGPLPAPTEPPSPPSSPDSQTSPVTTIEGENGVDVTYAPVQNTEHIENTETITSTSTRENGDEIPIYVGPGGWMWEITGPAPEIDGPLPAPTAPPTPPGNQVEEGGQTDTGGSDDDDDNDTGAGVIGDGGSNNGGGGGSTGGSGGGTGTDNGGSSGGGGGSTGGSGGGTGTGNGGSSEGGNDNNNNDNDNNEEDESCTVTYTATHVSVFCTVTSGQSTATEDCSTEAWTTATSCETIAASTVTTVSEIAEETPEPCSPETCGSGAQCPLQERDLVKRIPPIPASFPDPDDWFSPVNYGGDSQTFMRGEVGRAYQGADQHTTYRSVSLDSRSSTSQFIEWGDEPATLALAGLYGCTAVIAVSQKGAWIGHFWQNRVGDISGTLSAGIVETPHNERHLGIMRDTILDQESLPFVTILVPRPFVRAPDRTWSNEDDIGEDDEYLDRTVYDYIRPDVIEMFPERVRVEFYSPLVRVNGVETRAARGDTDFLTHRGKVLVQYRPGQATAGQCNRRQGEDRSRAQYRVWTDAHEMFFGPAAADEVAWPPRDGQIHGLQRISNAKRQDDGGTCEIGDDDDNSDTGGDDDTTGDDDTDDTDVDDDTDEEDTTNGGNNNDDAEAPQCVVNSDCGAAWVCPSIFYDAFCNDEGNCYCVSSIPEVELPDWDYPPRPMDDPDAWECDYSLGQSTNGLYAPSRCYCTHTEGQKASNSASRCSSGGNNCGNCRPWEWGQFEYR